MEKLFYTLEQYKTQARLYHKNMKEMGLDISYMQAMQLLAKSLNYKSWEILETKVLENELVFKVNSSSEITLKTEKSDNIWITVNNISVGVKSTDEGVVVDLYSLEKEDNEPLASTYAFYAEAVREEKDRTQKELILEWDKSNKKFKNTVHAYDIKKNYTNSPEKDSYNFQEYMIDNLMEECKGLFENRSEAKEFLFNKEANTILTTLHTKEAISNYYDVAKKMNTIGEMVVTGEVRYPEIDMKALNEELKYALNIKKNYQTYSEKEVSNFEEKMIDNIMKNCSVLFKKKSEIKDFLVNQNYNCPNIQTKYGIKFLQQLQSSSDLDAKELKECFFKDAEVINLPKIKRISK